MVSRPKVLLVDDNVKVLSDLQDLLGLEGFQVLCARDGEDTLRKAASFEPDIIVLDIRMPKINGRKVLPRGLFRGRPIADPIAGGAVIAAPLMLVGRPASTGEKGVQR